MLINYFLLVFAMGGSEISKEKMKEMKEEMAELAKELDEFQKNSLKKLEEWQNNVEKSESQINKKDRNYMVSIEKSHAFSDIAKILGNVLN